MSSSRTVRYKCPYCDGRFTKQDLIIHVDEKHQEMIPKDYSAFRVVFDYVNKKPAGYNGKCTECGGPTGWDENKGRYNRQCSNPKCKESYLKKFENNMKNKLGVERISSTVEGQEKMLANRKISGKYKFEDGVEKTYTGSYEKKALEFLDKVMHCKSDDVITPGPVLMYEYNGKNHMYISDIFYKPYDLIIEVKDGGDKPNNREMTEYREKQLKKEEYIIKNTNYNYIRLTNNDFSQLLAVFMDLKLQMVEKTGERVIHINENKVLEAMSALMTGYIPGIRDTGSVYIVNYMKNNVFSGETERGYGVSDNIKLTNLITRDKEGKLTKMDDDFLADSSYNIFSAPITKEDLSNKLKPYMGEFVEEGFIYECIFGHKFYTYDQILTEQVSDEVLDHYSVMDMIETMTKNIFKDIEGLNTMIILNNDDLCTKYHDIITNEYYIISNKNDKLYYKSSTPINESQESIFKLLIMGVK